MPPFRSAIRTQTRGVTHPVVGSGALFGGFLPTIAQETHPDSFALSERLAPILKMSMWLHNPIRSRSARHA
jgi:hypothetical protein